jgi:hypothetical protein
VRPKRSNALCPTDRAPLPLRPHPGTLELERGVDELIAAAAARSNSGTGQPAAAQGLKLDLKLLDGGATVEMSGDVVVTTDGMAVTPSGMGFTPMNASQLATTADDDWFATYSAGAAMLPGSAEGASGRGGGAASATGQGAAANGDAGGSGTRAPRPEEVAGLSPLLSPTNTKLCAALVDAF